MVLGDSAFGVLAYKLRHDGGFPGIGPPAEGYNSRACFERQPYGVEHVPPGYLRVGRRR